MKILSYNIYGVMDTVSSIPSGISGKKLENTFK